jgi:hypothetical protein
MQPIKLDPGDVNHFVNVWSQDVPYHRLEPVEVLTVRR